MAHVDECRYMHYVAMLVRNLDAGGAGAGPIVFTAYSWLVLTCLELPGSGWSSMRVSTLHAENQNQWLFCIICVNMSKPVHKQ